MLCSSRRYNLCEKVNTLRWTHFLCEKVAVDQVHYLHVPCTSQYRNIFIKELPSALLVGFRSSLIVNPSHTSTVVSDSR